MLKMLHPVEVLSRLPPFVLDGLNIMERPPSAANFATQVKTERFSGSAAVLTVTWGAVCVIAALGVFGGANLTAAAIAGLVVAAVGAVLAARMSTQPSTAAKASEPETPANQPFEDAVEAVPDPLLVVGAEEPDDLAGKRLVFANAAARALLRIPREGALLLSAIRRPEVLEAVDESLFGGLSGNVSFETGGAQDRFWRVWTAPLPSRGVKRLCVILMRDETDSRRNERMRADFLANASHELRTPLASLTGFIETLRGHARDDEAARDRFLGIMGVQADRMARLVDDLLSLSRIELNEHIRPEGACDLGLAVSDVVDALGLIAKEKDVTLSLAAPPKGAAVVVGDRDQIVQVIQNLADNALKYSPRGGVTKIEVTAGLTLAEASATDPRSPRLISADGGRLSLLTPDRTEERLYVCVKVTDQGPGMERRHLPRLAERFYRVEGQKSGDRQGTGLGLAIVKHIVNRHRGGLWVESAPERGSVFAAYFPSAAAQASGIPAAAVEAPAPAEAPRVIRAAS